MNHHFLKGLTGEVVTPKNPEYEEARQEWNRAIDKLLLVIVYVEEIQDVVNAVLWARNRGVQIRIRSGGHHYEGYSVGDCVLVIDISRLNAMKLDKRRNILRVEAGVKNSAVYDLIGSNGYVFPGGTCPTVGVSGFTLGGGWGFSSRLYGLGCDSLIELELVDYEGNLIKANNTSNADLFWACRGAGGERENRDWVRRRFEYIKSITNGSYVNFPISNLRNYEHEYFGENAPMLEKVNEKYDPYNVFRFSQGLDHRKGWL